MNTVKLPDGATLPAIGLGTWQLGESPAQRSADVGAVRLALEIGFRVIDTAEMYAEGGAEEVVGAALAEALRAGTLTREQLFVVSKVYPHNASREGINAACERSLRRLGLDHIDLYLLTGPAHILCAKRSPASRRCRRVVGSATGASATSTPTTWSHSSACPAAQAAR